MTTTHPASWNHYLQRMAQGDESALASLYDETSRVVFSVASRILRNQSDAEEVVLDVYVRAWRHAAQYDPQRGTVMAWLLTMVRTASIDRLRHRRTRSGREEVLEPAQLAIAGPKVSGEDSLAVRNALLTLPEEQRHPIELAYFFGLSHSELAEALGVPLGTVKSRVRAGLARLKEILSPIAPHLEPGVPCATMASVS